MADKPGFLGKTVTALTLTTALTVPFSAMAHGYGYDTDGHYYPQAPVNVYNIHPSPQNEFNVCVNGGVRSEAECRRIEMENDLYRQADRMIHQRQHHQGRHAHGHHERHDHRYGRHGNPDYRQYGNGDYQYPVYAGEYREPEGEAFGPGDAAGSGPNFAPPQAHQPTGVSPGPFIGVVPTHNP